jgi:DMSO/TMAO reductase YedYZ molybdopterin-dependent catalytic subunit
MRVLPDVVDSWPRPRTRRLLIAGTMIAAATALAGCAKFDAALGQRQAVVTFTDSATLAQRLAVRTACGKMPNVTPQSLPSNVNSAYKLQQVIYQINKASDADVALLEECLAKYPSVEGVTLQDSSDEGN